MHSVRAPDLFRPRPPDIHDHDFDHNGLALRCFLETSWHGSLRKNDPFEHRIVHVCDADWSDEFLKRLHLKVSWQFHKLICWC